MAPVVFFMTAWCQLFLTFDVSYVFPFGTDYIDWFFVQELWDGNTVAPVLIFAGRFRDCRSKKCLWKWTIICWDKGSFIDIFIFLCFTYRGWLTHKDNLEDVCLSICLFMILSDSHKLMCSPAEKASSFVSCIPLLWTLLFIWISNADVKIVHKICT